MLIIKRMHLIRVQSGTYLNYGTLIELKNKHLSFIRGKVLSEERQMR